MIRITKDEIRKRAETLAGRVRRKIRICDGKLIIGGATPGEKLVGCLLDLRTVLPDEEELLVQALS